MSKRRRLLPATLLLGLASIVGAIALNVAAPSEAECLDPALCRPQQTRLDDDGYLRALSLDLRGTIASPEEHARMSADPSAVDAELQAMVDEWMASPEFADRVVRRHRDLLWPNITNQTRLYHYRRTLADYSGSGLWQMSNGTTEIDYRGADVPCLDEPATFVGGRIQTQRVGEADVEGYVMVVPYWNPSGGAIRVCAFDAQEAQLSPSGNDCSTRAAIGDPGCGCGPNLRWCATNSVRSRVLRAFSEEMEQRVRAHVQADVPYHELLTGRTAFVNGPLAYFWRHHRFGSNSVHLVPAALEIESLPETDADFSTLDPSTIGSAPASAIRYEDETWTEITLPEEHSGLLTHPSYLLRFQTNRARANRFYTAFLCQPFQPPEGGIDVDDPVTSFQPDVQLRPGCNYCHAILEPAAAHWGRWTQQGGGYLAPEAFPEYRAECSDCGRGLESCSNECRFNYVVRALSPEEEPFLGRLTAFQFLRDEHRVNVDLGPAALVREGLADGRFVSCAVRRTAEWLFGRELMAEEEPLVSELTEEFLGSDFRYRELVRAVVMSDTYRRAL